MTGDVSLGRGEEGGCKTREVSGSGVGCGNGVEGRCGKEVMNEYSAGSGVMAELSRRRGSCG